MKESSCIINRPGGFEITDRAISLCSFNKEARILDLGCGSGATVTYLSEKYGFEVYGIDINLHPGNENKNLFRDSSENISFHTASMDGIIMECSFSLMEDQKKVLSEINRVLKESGRLIITDMYARGEPARLTGPLGRLNTREEISSLLEKQNFVIEHFEDYTKSLQATWGQMVMDKGSDAFYNSVGANREELKRIKCGYYMIVACMKGESA